MKESITLKCNDSISAEISMEIVQVADFSTQDLICKHAEFLRLNKKVINLGECN